MAKRFPDGIYFDKPHQNAPKFVLGRIALKREQFLAWLEGEAPNEKGYINLQVVEGKEGKKPYISVDEYQKPKTFAPKETTQEEAPF